MHARGSLSHSRAIVLIAAFFQIVWFGVCVGQLSGCGLVEVHVCVEVYLAAKVTPNPERDLLADIHRSAVLVGVRAIRIRAGISISVMKDKIRPRGLIHLSINNYVVIDREVNEYQTRLRERIRERLDSNGRPSAIRRFSGVAHNLMDRVGIRPTIASIRGQPDLIRS